MSLFQKGSDDEKKELFKYEAVVSEVILARGDFLLVYLGHFLKG